MFLPYSPPLFFNAGHQAGGPAFPPGPPNGAHPPYTSGAPPSQQGLSNPNPYSQPPHGQPWAPRGQAGFSANYQQQQGAFPPKQWAPEAAAGTGTEGQPKKRSRWDPAPERGPQDPMEEAVTAAVLKEQARVLTFSDVYDVLEVLERRLKLHGLPPLLSVFFQSCLQ